MNDAHLTLVGNLATDPTHSESEDGVPRTSFRLAHTPRWRRPDGWVDGETTYYTVTCWRQLALNAYQSLRKGDSVVVRGTFRGRDWSNNDRSGTTLEVAADSVGHDLARGTTIFRRTGAARPPVAQQQPADLGVGPAVAMGLRVEEEPASADVAAAV